MTGSTPSLWGKSPRLPQKRFRATDTTETPFPQNDLNIFQRDIRFTAFTY